MVDARGQFFFVMRDHNKCFSRTKTELFYDLPDKFPISDIKAMKRFVENEEFGVFHESTCQ